MTCTYWRCVCISTHALSCEVQTHGLYLRWLETVARVRGVQCLLSL